MLVDVSPAPEPEPLVVAGPREAVSTAEPVQVGGLDDLPDHPAELERDRGGAAAGDQAPQTARVPRRGEQRGCGAGAALW